ncbi:MAG: cell division protein ZapA [Flavobacteriaceae bacterium]|nr:cell division protein ZapA [Flavobacteriaceae bacterium]
MDEIIGIKVTIGNRVYPLKIKGEGEEEGIRTAVDKINKLINKFEGSYAVRDKQDVLAMCALQVCWVWTTRVFTPFPVCNAGHVGAEGQEHRGPDQGGFREARLCAQWWW